MNFKFISGIYSCSECNFPLFSSRSKFEHHSPWPSFTEPIYPNSISKQQETGAGYIGRRAIKVIYDYLFLFYSGFNLNFMLIIQISCGKCGNGLGHEFLQDGPDGKSRF